MPVSCCARAEDACGSDDLVVCRDCQSERAVQNLRRLEGEIGALRERIRLALVCERGSFLP